MSDWQPLRELPDLRRAGIIALDTETKDAGLLAKRGSSWPWNDGYICGVSVAYKVEGAIRAHYFPLKHPDSPNFDREPLIRWLQDLIASEVSIVTQNGLYDWGWLRADFGLKMPPSERLEEIGALATMIDENRHRYSLDALCEWRGLPGKDETLLREGCAALGLIPKRKKFKPQAYIWQLPARFVGAYAEADAISTLALYEDLDPILDQENTRRAYRLECDLLPMVHEMRRRGNRIDVAAAERARDQLLQKRDAAFAELSGKLGVNVGMAEIGKTKWLAATFDAHKIEYPLTEKGNPSFTAGNTGWMTRYEHWLPQLIVKADKYNNAAVNFLQGYILDQVVRGRVHPEINPHRSEQGGTRSLRFSYANPPLQVMPAHNEELAPLIRGVFLPEEGEIWAKPDLSQQEFRFIVHYAARHNLPMAREAVERYRNDPATDFHQFVSEMVGIERQSAKNTNFAKSFGAGVRKFAQMINKPENEARVLYERYDQELPFVSELSKLCERAARRDGYITLYDGARRHFNNFAPGGRWQKGLGPCADDEAIRRVNDRNHPWYRRQLWRTDTHKAMNALIQGSAARHTKRWMLACWREGIVPLLQMHDSLDCSVWSPKQAEMVARLGCEAVTLEVPMRVDLAYGRNWGDAKHTWEELHAETSPHVESAEGTQREGSNFSNDFDEALAAAAAIPAHEVDWNAALQRDFPRTATATETISTDPPQSPPAPEPPQSTASESRPPKDEKSSTNGRGDFRGFTRQDSYQSGEDEGPTEPDPRGPTPPPQDEYIYIDAQNRLHTKVMKRVWFDAGKRKKSYPTYHWANGAWVKGWPEQVIPFRLPELLATPLDALVLLCEGEMNCLVAAQNGFAATCNPGGAKQWQPELAQYFQGRQRVCIMEDHDADGAHHTGLIIKALRDIVPTLGVVRFPELPPKGDLADYFARGGTKAGLLIRIEEALKAGITPTVALDSISAAEVEIEDFDWVWPDRFALRKIGLIAGLPDEGKGQLISDIIARVTRGAAWPCNEGHAPLGNVILFTAEDDIKDTITPRLMAANADLQHVTIMKMMHEEGVERMFSLVTDLAVLRQKVLEVGGVKMIVIDPISAYLGIDKMDSFRATDVRAILGPLKELAENMELMILGIMHFNKKIDVTNLLLRISDSLAYGAAARHVYGVVNDPDNHRRLFVRGKNNIARAEQKTLAFSFAEREVGISKKTGRPVRAPHIVWQQEPVDITATEALQAAAESKSPSARDSAKRFLTALLSNGPVGSKEVHEAAKENGISKMTLNRAKDELGIDVRKNGPLNDKGEATWQWHAVRPEAGPEPAQ